MLNVLWKELKQNYMNNKLSNMVRPNSEASPWVIESIKILEDELEVKEKAAMRLLNGISIEELHLITGIQKGIIEECLELLGVKCEY